MYDRFSGIKLWSCERNTENAMSHLHFNEESDYSEENTCENEVFCSTLERNIFTPQLLIYYKQYQNRKSRLVQMPEAATGGALRKKVSFKMSQNSQKTPVSEKTPVKLQNFTEHLFYRTTLYDCFWNPDIAITKREIYIAFVVEYWMQCFIASAKTQSMREASHHPAFMGVCSTISHTY